MPGMKPDSVPRSGGLSIISLLVAAGLGFGATMLVLSPGTAIPAIQSTAMPMLSSGYASFGDCKIKGNVSFNSREKIYHVPGQQDYNVTRISPDYGERWFCSEAEARSAGWRKAGS